MYATLPLSKIQHHHSNPFKQTMLIQGLFSYDNISLLTLPPHHGGREVVSEYYSTSKNQAQSIRPPQTTPLYTPKRNIKQHNTNKNQAQSIKPPQNYPFGTKLMLLLDKGI